MNMQQLKYYTTLCREKNFTEAGFVCGLTQSALSKQIQKLEKELDVTLIRRNTRMFELTEEGKILEKYAESTLKAHEDMLKKIHSVKEIRIGSMPVLSPYHISSLFTEFRKLHPDIQLTIVEHPADQILADIRSYDFLILRSLLMTDTRKYCFQTLCDDRPCAILYDSHPLAQKDSIWLSELKNETFIFPEKGSGGYEAFYQSCLLAGFEPDIQYNFPQANTVFSFVREKAGVAVHFTKVYQEFACNGIKMLPLKDEFHYPISLIYLKNRRLPESHKLFLRFIKERAVKLQDSF